tara:strand:- start:246 stop:650 length:405 start_codon:yes stop_codon:yes gene_type:complete
MTNSNFTPEYNNEPVPGTEVTEQPGLYPENIAPDTPDGVVNVPYPTDDSANGSVTFDASTADETFTVDYPPAPLDPRVDHVLGLLEELNAKVEHLLEHAHKEADCCPPPEPPVVYEGLVTLQPVPQTPPPEYQN